MAKLTVMQMRAKKEMIAKWPSGVVARSSVDKFSGGLVKASSLSVADCEGHGCKRLSSERKTLYVASDLADWIVRKFSENHKEGKVAG